PVLRKPFSCISVSACLASGNWFHCPRFRHHFPYPVGTSSRTCLTFNHVYGFYRASLVLWRLAPDEHDPVLTYSNLASRLVLQHTNHRALSSNKARNLSGTYLDDPAC